MPIASWPADVPYSPLQGSLQIERTVEAPLSADMNAGTTRRRRKYTVRIGACAMLIQMTDAEADEFRIFHEDTLFDGASRFTMPIWFAGRFLTQTSLFAEPPTYDHFTPGYVKVSFSLLVENLGSGAVYVPPDEPDPEFVPSFDFSDPRNSGYLVLLDIAVPAGSFTPSFDFSEPLNSGYLVLLGDY